MCLFPLLDYGIDIVDFENFDFLVGQPIFTSVRASPAGQNLVSSIRDLKQPNLNLLFRRDLNLTQAKAYAGIGFFFLLPHILRRVRS